MLQAEVLFLVICGKDNQATTNHLSVYSSTICKHLEGIYRKLGVQSRTEAIAQKVSELKLQF